ncbi:hypothetical protein BJV77DRAFT_1019753, partial [Russula vinacea]
PPLGGLNLQHRVVMAPLTRFRANKSHVHGELAKTYYDQRATVPGTLIIAEATFIAPQAAGYENVPGIWSDAQIAGWKAVTDAVHAKGSANAGVLKTEGNFEVVGPMIPRELTVPEIKEYAQLYAKAARNAIEAGFDGVEIHGANGYLVDQFLQSVSNERTDEYGGSIQNRLRFPLEVIDAVVKAVGAERTGIRLSPWSKFQGMGMEDPVPTFTGLLEHIREAHPNFAYVHVIEDVWGGRPYIAADTVEKHGGLIAFGRHFIANPDLPLRLKEGISLTPYNRDTFYLAEAAVGYVDYPFANEVAPLKA